MGELHPAVQAKLLRVLETRELVPLGAVDPRPIDLRLCCATLTNLHAAISTGRFRADLYYRIARRVVSLPPLRERREEIPWLAAAEVARVSPALSLHAGVVEWLLLQPWPGNVRELFGVVRAAAEEAARADSPTVNPPHLPDDGRPPPSKPTAVAEPDAETVRRALAEHGGNLSAVARALKLHRSQLYRLLKQLGIDRG